MRLLIARARSLPGVRRALEGYGMNRHVEQYDLAAELPSLITEELRARWAPAGLACGISGTASKRGAARI